MNHLDRFTFVVKALQDHHIDVAIFDRHQEILSLIGAHPYWGGSILAISSTGRIRFFVPDYDPLIARSSPKCSSLTDFAHCEYAWGAAKSDPFEHLEKQLFHEFAKPDGSRLTITFGQDYIFTAPSRNFGEGSIIPRSFLSSLQHPDNPHFQYQAFPAELNTLGLIKDAEDLAALKLSHNCAQKGIDIFMSVSQCEQDSLPTTLELQAKMEHAIMMEGALMGASYAKSFAMIQCGSDTANAYRYNLTQNTKIKPGDLLFLELSACINGYWLDLTRVTVAGKGCASPKHEEIFNLVKAARDAAITVLRDNIKACDVYAAAHNVFAAAKVDTLFPHALGHATGYGYHDFGLSINATSETKLKSGMVITIEPGLYSSSWGFGLRIEENIVVTDDGCELLSQAQQSLQV